MQNQDDGAGQGAARHDPAAIKRRSGRPGRVLRWAAIVVGGPLAAVILGVSIFVAFGIPLDLSWLRDRIDAAATHALNRSIVIEGPIKLVPTLWPTLQVQGIRVGNPAGWPEADFVRVDLARAQLGVLPLLLGDIRIEEITVEGLAANLETNDEGEPNWLLKAPGATPQPQDSKLSEEAPPPALRFVELERLSLTDIAASFRKPGSEETFEVKLDEIMGSAEKGQPMHLSIQGSIQEVPYEATLTAGSLASLVDDEAAWQLDVSAAALGTELAITGEIAEPLRGKGMALDFDLKGPEMKELEAILGMKLPPVRSFDLRGRFEEAAGAYRVAGLEGTLGRTAISGELQIDTAGSRPRVQGAIEIPRIDAGPLSAAIAAAEANRPDTDDEERPPETAQPAEPDRPIDLDQTILVLDPLDAFDADFSLSIGEVVNSAVAISKASLKVNVADGKLTGPINATVARVPFAGEVRLERQNGQPAASVSLSATGSDIGELLALLTPAEGVEGSFETAELAASARGGSIRSLVESMELRFSIGDAALSYGHAAGEQPVAFTLDTFETVFPAAAESSISAKGTLLEEPFSLDLRGGTFIENYVERNWPIELTATGGGAELRFSGTVAHPEDGLDSEFEFALAGDRVGGLARWIGVSPDAAPPYVLKGSATLGEGRIAARVGEARIGNTAFTGKVGIAKEDGKPVTLVELAIKAVDTAELSGLFPEKPEAAEPQAGEQAFTIDVPILPRGIELIDSDIAVSIDRIKMKPSDITDVSFTAKIRNGRVEKAPLRAVIANAALEGSVSTDLQGEVPTFDLDLHSAQLDVGDLLARLGVAQGLHVTAGRFDLSLSLRGASVRTMMERSTFSAGIQDGLLRLRDPNTQGSVDIGIRKGTIEAPVGKPIALVLDGRIDRIPVEIAIRTDSLASFAEPKQSLRAQLDVKLLNAALSLTGTAPLPLGSRNARFALDLAGERFSDFDELLKVSLPPWGPYSLAGEFGTRESGYYIENLQLGVGSSTLSGALEFDTTQAPPHLKADFVARTIQLDDFDTSSWSAAEGEDAPAKTVEAEADTGERVRRLLSPQVMRNLDGAVTVGVEEVLSGQDRLGSGKVVARLSGGRLAVEPLTVNVPGGTVDVGFALEPTETDVALEARAEIDQLDYGLLARRIDPQSTTGGLISVDVDVSTRGRTLKDVMAESNGHIDFAVWPRDLNAGIFDLWAVNLFTSILPSLDSQASKVNCLVARFTLEDGMMRPTALLVDTSRIQASGNGKIDFKTKTIDLSAAPKSKKPQMFSARTPIKVEGRFEDFEVGLKTGALAGTVVRMITSPVVVPFEWVFTKNEPADGKIACQKAWGRMPQG